MPQYLDESGNPMSAPPNAAKVYLDDQGNPKSPARHGATGSWDGFGQGVKDAVTAPFKSKSWKSLTDNPIINPLRDQMASPDLLTPTNMSALNRSAKMPSPYEAGGMTANAVMAGTPEAVRSGVKAVIPSPVRLAPGDVPTPGAFARAASAVKAGGPDIGKGLAKIGGGAAAFETIPGEAGKLIVGYPLVRSGMRDIGTGFRSGVNELRGPVQGPSPMPARFKLPADYPESTGRPQDPVYTKDNPRPGPMRVEVSPRTVEEFMPSRGVSLPSGRTPGPVPGPGEPGGPAPGPLTRDKVLPVWNSVRGTSREVPEFTPQRASLPSGRAPGSMARGAQLSEEMRTAPKPQITGGTAGRDPFQLTPFQSIKNTKAISAQNPYEGPGRLRQTLGTQAEMMRQRRLADLTEEERSELQKNFDARGILRKASGR